MGRLRGDHLDMPGLRRNERPGKPVNIDKTEKKEFIYNVFWFYDDSVWIFHVLSTLNLKKTSILDLAADREKTWRI
jgi:hypothetical protein